MLLITREIDYALRILRSLRNGKQYTATQLSEREHLPLQFSYKILKKLARGGFVKVERGSEGGARLMTELKERTLYDLITAMEGKREISACMQDGFHCAWKAENGVCSVHCQLKKTQEKIADELRAQCLESFFTRNT